VSPRRRRLQGVGLADIDVLGPAGRPFKAIAASLVVSIACVLPMFLTGALAISMGAEFRISPAQLGFAVSTFSIFTAMSSRPAGWFADRAGWQWGIRAAAAASAVSLAGISVAARSYVGLLAFLAVGGTAFALGVTASNLALARAVGASRRGLYFGLKQSAGPAATLIAGLSLTMLESRLGWRGVFGMMALVAPVGVLLTLRTPRHPSGRRRPGQASTGGPPTSALVRLAVAGGCSTMAVTATAAFLVVAAATAGMSAQVAGAVLTVGSVAGLVCRLLLGWLTDTRLSRDFVVVAALLTGGSVGHLLLATARPGLMIGGGIVAFGLGWGWPGVFHHMVVRTSMGAPGRATGVVLVGLSSGGAIGPFAFGLIVERASYAAAWLTLAGLALFAAALVAWTERSATGMRGTTPSRGTVGAQND
jgi:MFS family permease